MLHEPSDQSRSQILRSAPPTDVGRMEVAVEKVDSGSIPKVRHGTTSYQHKDKDLKLETTAARKQHGTHALGMMAKIVLAVKVSARSESFTIIEYVGR